MNILDREEIIEISKIKFDEELYPRTKTNWLTVYQYQQAMKVGSIFPPIIIGEYEGEYYLIDGWHRVAALIRLKQNSVKAIIKTYNSKKEMFIDAVKFNSTHGRPLSVQDKVKIIDKLKKLKIDDETISKLVKIPVGKLKKFEKRAIDLGPGRTVYVKKPIADVLDKKNPQEIPTIVSTINQEPLNTRTAKHLMIQLCELLEADLVDFNDKEVKDQAAKLYFLLDERLKEFSEVV